MFEASVEVEFSAAHRLREYAGACERLHGHNYRVMAVVAGERLGPAGMLVDFKDLKRDLASIVNTLDHHCLNEDIADFASGRLNPTAENIAWWVATKLAERLPEGLRLARLTVWESDRSAATYVPS
jgi:6-pyruvoyltetrahydropterin/6-carboxytetrahydropterin synthase